MKLDDLALGHVRNRLPRQQHHENRADREVGGDEDSRLAVRALDLIPQAVQIETAGPDHRVHAGAHALADVCRRGVRRREVHDHVAVPQHVAQRHLERRIGTAHQLHVVGTLDRLADGLAHAARSAGDADPDHAAASASLTEALASLKSSSWGPMQAAERRSGS